MSYPSTSEGKGRQRIRTYDLTEETARHRASKETGYVLNTTKSSMQVCCHPMTVRIISIEVIARVGHDPSKGCFSGAVGSVVGVHSNHSGRLADDIDAEEVGIKLAHARLHAMSHQCKLQVFIDFDKLIDISAADKLWSVALCKTRVSFVAIASRIVMHMNWQIHCRECDERKLSPCKRCFTSVPPHPAHRHTLCSYGWALCKY